MTMNDMRMATLMAEDCGAPEMRNPRTSGMKPLTGWIRKLFMKKNG